MDGYENKKSPVITRAAADAIRTAANSNQEESQTVARRLGKERLEDLAVLLAASDYQAAYDDTQKHGMDILDYSESKGQKAWLGQRGQEIVDRINQASGTQIDVEFLKNNADRIYAASSIDGSQIILPYTKGDGSTVNIKTGISLKADKGENSILYDIGGFGTAYKRQKADARQLTTDAGVDEHTLMSLNNVRTGNYRALDERLKLTERYNAFIYADKGDKVTAGRAMIRNFSGRQKELDMLRNAADENGNSIFSQAELDELEECVRMNGVSTERGNLGMMAREAARRSRHRIANKMLDEYQGSTVNTIQKSVGAARMAGRTANETAGLAGELRAGAANRKVNRLLDQREKLIATGNYGPLGKYDRKLAKQGRRLGVDAQKTSSEELRKRAQAAQDRAREIRQARRDLNRAAHGLDRKERKEVVMRLRMEDALARNNSVKTARLAKQHGKLVGKIEKNQNHKYSLTKAVGKVKKKAAAKLANTAVGKAVGAKMAVLQGIEAAAGAAIKSIIGFLAPIIAGFGVIVVAAATVVSFIVLIIFLFFPDKGDKNVLQSVNTVMSDYEIEQLNALKVKAGELIKKTDAYQNPESLAVDENGNPRTLDSMCWRADGRMLPEGYAGKISYHGQFYEIEGLFVRQRVRVDQINSRGRRTSHYETRWCEILPENGACTFYLRYRDGYTDYVWDSANQRAVTLALNNTNQALPNLSGYSNYRNVRANGRGGPAVTSGTRYVNVNLGDTDDDGADNYGMVELKDSMTSKVCFYVKFTVPGDHFWQGSTAVMYCMNFRSDGKLERYSLDERLSWDEEDRDDKIHPDIDLDYAVVDENGRASRICNCMQCLTLYRYYYKWTDEGQGDAQGGELAEDSWTDRMFVGNYERKMKQAWNETHYINATHRTFPWIFGTTQEYLPWKKALDSLKMDDMQLENGLPGLSGQEMRSTHTDAEVRSGQCDKLCYFYSKRKNDTADIGDGYSIPIMDMIGPYCCGHYRTTVEVVTVQDMNNIASGNTLEGRFGINIEYAKDFSEEAKADIKDLIGSYEDGFAEGFQNWADFEVYFGPAKNRLSQEAVDGYMEEIRQKYFLSEKQEAFLRNAFAGCGQFTYQEGAYNLCLEGQARDDWTITAGFADSAGYVNWARNKTGLYPSIKEYTIDDWAVTGGRNGRFATVNSRTGTVTPKRRRDLAQLPPGTLLIRGESGSDHNSIAIWTGLFDPYNKDSDGYGEPIVIECISGSVNGSILHKCGDVLTCRRRVLFSWI